MLLLEGDRPADGDIWFRIITSSDHISKGRVHHAAFRKKNFFRPPKPERNCPWDYETSGRLRSIAGSLDDIAKAGEEYAVKNKTHYVGVMYPSKPLTCTSVGSLTLDFRYTPIDDDRAHADLITNGVMPRDKTAEHEQLMHDLTDCFKALHSSQIEYLPPANITILQKIRLLLHWCKRKLV